MLPETVHGYSAESLRQPCVDYVGFGSAGHAKMTILEGGLNDDDAVEFGSYAAMYPNPDDPDKVFAIIPDFDSGIKAYHVASKIAYLSCPTELTTHEKHEDISALKREEYDLHKLGYPLVVLAIGQDADTDKPISCLIYPNNMGFERAFEMIQHYSRLQAIRGER